MLAIVARLGRAAAREALECAPATLFSAEPPGDCSRL
jgi:hypothetical protein